MTMHQLVGRVLLLILLAGVPYVPEGQIGDFRLGKTTLDEFAKSTIGRFRIREGIFELYVDETCYLAAVDPEVTGDRSKPIATLTLYRSTFGDLSTACASIRTSKGIGLNANMRDVISTYGRPVVEARKLGIVEIWYDNRKECAKHSEITNTSVFIRYSEKLERVVSISISTERMSCK